MLRSRRFGRPGQRLFCLQGGCRAGNSPEQPAPAIIRRINESEQTMDNERIMDFRYFKIEVFIPETHFRPLQRALQEVGAGHIGRYDSCLSYSRVTGTWRPLEGTDPYIGRLNEISEEPELKVEVTVQAERLDRTLEAIGKVHPYEEAVINVIPLYRVGI